MHPIDFLALLEAAAGAMAMGTKKPAPKDRLSRNDGPQLES